MKKKEKTGLVHYLNSHLTGGQPAVRLTGLDWTGCNAAQDFLAAAQE